MYKAAGLAGQQDAQCQQLSILVGLFNMTGYSIAGPVAGTALSSAILGHPYTVTTYAPHSANVLFDKSKVAKGRAPASAHRSRAAVSYRARPFCSVWQYVVTRFSPRHRRRPPTIVSIRGRRTGASAQ